MATRTRANFKSTVETRFTTNGTGAITGSITNDMFEDAADSFLMPEDLGISVVKVTVSSGEILIANSSPKTLIAAPGAGKLIELISFSMFLDYNSAAYATNVTLRISYDTSVIIYSTPSVLAQTSDTYLSLASPAFTPTTTDLSNKAIFFDVQTGNPTAGNSPLNIYLTYRTITL